MGGKVKKMKVIYDERDYSGVKRKYRSLYYFGSKASFWNPDSIRIVQLEEGEEIYENYTDEAYVAHCDQTLVISGLYDIEDFPETDRIIQIIEGFDIQQIDVYPDRSLKFWAIWADYGMISVESPNFFAPLTPKGFVPVPFYNYKEKGIRYYILFPQHLYELYIEDNKVIKK